MQFSEIIILGGGVIGLAIAIELRLLGAEVRVLSADFKAAAGHAAAGMLAPQAEQIPPGAMLDLCLASRALYPKWVERIRQISNLDPGYWPCGILAPRYTDVDRNVDWLDRSSIEHHQPGLNPTIAGGYWYPADGQVDNRALINALWVGCQSLGVKLQDGIEVTTIHHHHSKITHLDTTQGEISAQHYILATGAWTQQLLAIPITPRKGQMLSLRVPSAQLDNLPLQQVLFGEEIYIVPRQDGKIVIGATSENVGFAPCNTAAGTNQLLANAIRLFPALADFQLEECWWGFRPATPDELPILGASSYSNLTLATGHYRNGILLTPITAKSISNLVWHQQSNELLSSFNWERFKIAIP
jgi:glycine oxidase